MLSQLAAENVKSGDPPMQSDLFKAARILFAVFSALSVSLLSAGCGQGNQQPADQDKSANAPVTAVIPDTETAASTPDLPEVQFCVVPDPLVPSSAFDIFHSEPQGRSGYWVRYTCKQICNDWHQCLVPAYSDDHGTLIPNGRHPETPKQALAFVVDGMGGHLALSSDGEKTVFAHTGAGGTRYYSEPMEKLEKKSSARTVMVRWEKGYTASIFQPPFAAPVTWGWYSRTSEKPTNIRELNKRVASIISWTHENLTNGAMFGTIGCSMGTNATFLPVLWHGLDSIIDYQLFVGGPNMWDLNAQCGRRHYATGYCDVDGVTTCKDDSDCLALAENSHCTRPSNYTTIDKLFEDMPNHVHVTDACDIRASDESTEPYPPFDQSSMAFSTPADWVIHHRVDFLVNVGGKQGASFAEGIGGDEYWGLGNFPFVYNKIQPAENKQWHFYPDSHHCGALESENAEALDVIRERMDL